MDLTVLMIFECFDMTTHKEYKRTKRIEFCGIKDFKYTKDYISFVEFGRLSETNIETDRIIEFSLDYSDTLFE